MNEQAIWDAAERLQLLFGLLPKRIQSRRSTSFLRLLTDRFMDYITRSNPGTEKEALEIGRAILAVYRTTRSIEQLYGQRIDSNIVNHSLFREIERLFDKSEQAFDAVDFMLFTAACLSRRTGLTVHFVPEKPGAPSPDLQVGNVCYVECKDLAIVSAVNLDLSLKDRLAEAGEQVAAAQGSNPLAGAGAAIDVPLQLAEPEFADSLEPVRKATETVREVLSLPGPLGFVTLSLSGIHHTGTEVAFPHRAAVFIRSGLPSPVLSILGKLTRDGRVYFCS